MSDRLKYLAVAIAAVGLVVLSALASNRVVGSNQEPAAWAMMIVGAMLRLRRPLAQPIPA